MSVPLYQAKAEFFRMPAHPARTRVRELLTGAERAAGRTVGSAAARSGRSDGRDRRPPPDTSLRLHPKTLTGIRLARVEA